MGAILRGVTAWIIGAIIAVTVGMLALTRIGYGLASDPVHPLSRHASGGAGLPQAAASTSPLPSPPPEPSPSKPAKPVEKPDSPSVVERMGPPPVPPAPDFQDHLLTSRGGNAIVRCTGNTAVMRSWIPAQGFHAEENARRGPAAVVSVEFEAGNLRVLLSARCAGGAVHPETRQTVDQEDDD